MEESIHLRMPLLNQRESDKKSTFIELQTLKRSTSSTHLQYQPRHDEILDSHKLEQVLEAREQWRSLLRKKPQLKQTEEPYFTFQYEQLLQIFDINLIMKEAQLNKQDDKDLREKRLKIQTDRLNSLGGVYGLQNFLRTCIKTGLDDINSQDLRERELYFGRNTKPQVAIKSLLKLIAEQFQKERLFQLLIMVTFFNCLLTFEETIYQHLIFLGLIITMTIYKAVIKQQYSKEIVRHQNDIKDRNKHLDKRCNVLRNGDNTKEINNDQLVVGDILVFKQGDFIQCDGIITKVTSPNCITVTQPFQNIFNSNEEKNIEETHENMGLEDTMSGMADNFIFSGSQIIQGQGYMLVCSVGEKASDYIQYKQAFIEEGQSEKAYLKASSMYNPFAFKIESLMNKIAIQCLGCLLVLCVILIIRSNSLRDLANIILYLVQLALITIPTQLLSQINLFMIYVIKKCRAKQIYLQDYLALYWLGQVNEMIVDQLDTSVSMFNKSQINIRYFTSLQAEEALEIAQKMQLLDQRTLDRYVEGAQLSNGFNDKNKFTFISRRLACPTLDHQKIDKIQSTKTLEWLEQQSQKFQFQGIVDQQKIYEEFKNKNVIVSGNKERKEQFINLLKLYDKIIFMNGDEGDRKALEMAHVSIGPHESRACIKLFGTQQTYIQSMYECVSQGRSVYFYILSYSLALTCTSQTLMIYAIVTGLLAQNIYIMPIPTFIIFFLILNHFSYLVGTQCNKEVQGYVMQRAPYVKQGRIVDRFTMRKLYKLHSILLIELCIAWYYGWLPYIQEVFVGLIFSKHVFILARPIKQVLQQIEGIIYGLIIVLINQFLMETQTYAQVQILLRNYSIGLLVVAFNLFIGYT